MNYAVLITMTHSGFIYALYRGERYLFNITRRGAQNWFKTAIATREKVWQQVAPGDRASLIKFCHSPVK